MSEFSRALTRVMKMKRMTQGEVAKHVGVKRQTIAAYMKCDAEPTLPRMKKLAELFGVSIDELAGVDVAKREGEELSFDAYQKAARRTQREDMTPEQKLMHALHGMTSEVGEIHGVFQKSYQGHPLSKEKLIDETGDLLWFVAELCDALDINIADVARANLDKLWRRYPAGFDSVRSRERGGE